MITSLYASLLAILYFKISIDTVRARRRFKISLGTGENNELLKYVSAHSNFSAYTPMLLILTFLLETSEQFPPFVIYIIASVFTLGRLLHYLGMTAEKMNFKLRVPGMAMTFMSLNALAVLNLFAYVKINFL